MNSKQYKQVMQQIQMPASCEQSILNQIHAPSQPKTVHHSKRHGWIAAAAAACIAITSVVTVSAARDSNWFGLFSKVKQIIPCRKQPLRKRDLLPHGLGS